jgi:hypothetical protein
MLKTKYVVVLYLLLVNSICLFSQETIKISGKVIDENNKPFPNVNIFLSQSKKGTITNKDGEFFLNSLGKSDILQVLYLGYETYSVKVNANTGRLIIRLEPSPFELGEVIVNNLSAEELIKRAIKKIPDNYELEPFLNKMFYRAKVTEKDTLLYLEETSFNIIESYRKKFDTEYFLVNNRNFKFTPEKWVLRQIGQFDMVKSASRLFDKSFFQNQTISYMPNSSLNNRTVYVLSISPKSEEGHTGKIYIDVEDLAFVHFDLHLKKGDEVATQYLKIGNKYYVMNGHSVHLNKRHGDRVFLAESNMVTTNIIQSFSKEDIEGTPVNSNDILEEYATQKQDTIFWKEHNSILPDSTIIRAIKGYEQKQIQDSIKEIDSRQHIAKLNRLYTPNLSLITSSDWNKDFYSLNYNSVSISHYVNYQLFDKMKGNYFLPLLASAAYYYTLSIPFEEVLDEKKLLNINGLSSKIDPFSFNKYSKSYLYNLREDILNDYKTNDYNNFMRLHTIRNDGHFVKAMLLEEELAKVDLSNKNNFSDFMKYYFVGLFAHRSLNIYNPFKKGDVNVSKNVSIEKQPLIIDGNRSWVKYLFEPETNYQRHIMKTDLTNEEEKFLKRSAKWSWINLISPQMLGIGKFRIGKGNSFTFSFNYLRVPFGEMFGQNIWLMTHDTQLHGIFVRQYKNYDKTTFGIGYKLYDFKLVRNLRMTSSFDLWQQPKEFLFKDQYFRTGFHIGQMFEYQFLPNRYTGKNKLSLGVGYDYKTQGYFPQSYFLEKNFDVKFGFKWGF